VTGLATEGGATTPRRSGPLVEAAGRLRAGGRWIWWYLRELTGEADYDKYVAHLRTAHPEAPVPSRRAFERDKTDPAQRNPSVRCC